MSSKMSLQKLSKAQGEALGSVAGSNLPEILARHGAEHFTLIDRGTLLRIAESLERIESFLRESAPAGKGKR